MSKKYDICASSIRGFDRSLGDELVFAYQLPLPEPDWGTVSNEGQTFVLHFKGANWADGR